MEELDFDEINYLLGIHNNIVIQPGDDVELHVAVIPDPVFNYEQAGGDMTAHRRTTPRRYLREESTWKKFKKVFNLATVSVLVPAMIFSIPYFITDGRL